MKRKIGWVLMGLSVALLAACKKEPEVPKPSVSQRAGAAVGGAATDFISGLGAGVDEKMKVATEFDASFASHGLEATIGKGRSMGTNLAAIYVVAGDTPFKGKVVAKALDQDGKEIGRAQTELELAADDATYVTMTFNEEMDSNLVRKYLLSVR